MNWDWPEIAVVLMWKLAPEGVVITRKDLARLPQDLVLVEDRTADEIRFSWETVSMAQKLTEAVSSSVSTLEGRWQKIAVVLMWKLAKDGVTLTQWDRDQIPHGKTLLAHGHAQDIEYRFVPRLEAERIAAWEREHEGKSILEVVH